MIVRAGLLACALPLAFAGMAHAAGNSEPQKMSPQAKPVEHSRDAFGPDPSYEDKPYDAKKQIEIYGGKKAIDAPRPVVEIGRPIYVEGPFRESYNLIGEKNLISPAFNISGDWRTAIAFADGGAQETARIATDVNLEVDFKLTGTERFHALIEPFEQRGQFMNYQFAGDDRDQGNAEFNVNLETMFFEGDLGAIYAGLADEYVSFDLPVSAGLMPILLQNGIWVDDAFTGFAFAIPALNSPKLDISNMDFTFFAGFDKVTTPAIKGVDGELADHGVNIFGVAAFIETGEGYIEAGLGRVDGSDRLDDFSYNSATIAFSRRYGGWLSNSVRAIWTWGQDATNVQQTADGTIFLVENSLITSKPSTFIPYFNFWAGFDRPQPLADETGLLKNTGINFEADALTGFPKLDDTGQDTFGGAIGLQYLFNLDQQIVVEAATVQVIGGDNNLGRPAAGDQYALGLRYQLPVSAAWIFRADAMYGWLENADDIAGTRLEIRRKF